jgi:hypothetical protein
MTKKETTKESAKDETKDKIIDFPKLDLNDINRFAFMPRTELGKCNFVLYDALVACDIDALFNFTEQNGGYLMNRVYKDGRQDYAMFGDGTHGFTEYVHWRRLDAYILAFTRDVSEIHDKARYVHAKRDGIVLSEMKSTIPDGLDVVVVCSEGSTVGEDIIYSLDIVEKHMKNDVKFIAKISFNEDTKKIIYALTKIFKNSYIVKPLADNPYSNDFYYIGKDLNGKMKTLSAEYTDDYNKWFSECIHDIISYRKFFVDMLNNKHDGVLNMPAFNRVGVIMAWNLSDSMFKRYY